MRGHSNSSEEPGLNLILRVFLKQCKTLWAPLCHELQPPGVESQGGGTLTVAHHSQSLFLEMCSHPSNVSIFKSFFHIVRDACRQISPTIGVFDTYYFLFKISFLGYHMK